MENLRILWDNLAHNPRWEASILLAAVIITLIVSTLFTIRMLKFKHKSLLESMITFREFSWALFGFRAATGLGLNWNWDEWSWVVWTILAVATVATYVAQSREHILGGNKKWLRGTKIRG